MKSSNVNTTYILQVYFFVFDCKRQKKIEKSEEILYYKELFLFLFFIISVIIHFLFVLFRISC
jgi:hypothetical protein